MCWERFKDLLSACPHHGYEDWRLLNYFYDALSPRLKQFVESMCNGTFLDKIPGEAFDYFNFLAESVQSWDTQNDYDRLILITKSLEAVNIT